MGLTEQLHRIIAEFGHLLPHQHVKTLEEAGDALAVEPDAETPNPSYVPQEKTADPTTTASGGDATTPAASSAGAPTESASDPTAGSTPSTSTEASSGASSTP